VLLGAALFVAACFLPYYGFPGERSLSLYDQLLVAQDGGLELGAILFLFGGVAAVLMAVIVGLTRGERQSGRGFLAGAVSAWSLTWIGSLLRTASCRRDDDPPRALIGGGLLAAGREYRRSGHRNHPGGYPTAGSTRTRFAEHRRVMPVRAIENRGASGGLSPANVFQIAKQNGTKALKTTRRRITMSTR
jgi:hypothetical protein